MITFHSLRCTSYFAILLILTAGCVNDPEEIKQGLELGESRDVITLVTSGTPIDVTVKDGQFTGFGLQIHPQAYPTGTHIRVTASPIKNNAYGSDIDPITPLYTFSADQDFADANMIITIPADIAQNKFAMGFYYDPLTHTLEGIPVYGFGLHTISLYLRQSGNFFISQIDKAKLNDKQTSNFQRKRDTWQQVNYGNVIIPSGHFAGQSLSQLWYYYRHTLKGDIPLWSAYNSEFDSSNTVSVDNAEGIYFYTLTEKMFGWKQHAASLFSGIREFNAELTRLQLQYSILVTKKPQLITLLNYNDERFPLVVYEIQGDVISCADPNFPSDARKTMQLHNNNAVGYVTAYTRQAADQNKLVRLTLSYYMGVGALIDMNKISAIADSAHLAVAKNVYPSDISISSKANQVELQPFTFHTLGDSLIAAPNNSLDKFTVFHNGRQIDLNSKNTYLLVNGINHFGFASTRTDVSGIDLWKGWTQVTIIKRDYVTIMPILDSGYIGDNVIFRAKTLSVHDPMLTYVWDAGDGRSPITTQSDTFRVRYLRAGSFQVRLTIIDGRDGSTFSAKEVTARIRTYECDIYFQNPIASTVPFTTVQTAKAHSDKRHLRYSWDFGDGSPSVSMDDSAGILHAYKNPGTYTARLVITLLPEDVPFGKSLKTITITEAPTIDVAALKKAHSVLVEHTGEFIGRPLLDMPTEIWILNSITWDADTFKGTYYNKIISNYPDLPDYIVSTYIESREISGVINKDGTLQSINASWNIYRSYYVKEYLRYFTESKNISISYKNLHASYDNDYQITYLVSGAACIDHILYISGVVTSSPKPSSDNYYYESTNWYSINNPPAIRVVFYK